MGSSLTKIYPSVVDVITCRFSTYITPLFGDDMVGYFTLFLLKLYSHTTLGLEKSNNKVWKRVSTFEKIKNKKQEIRWTIIFTFDKI